jgi:hypothetical protein
LYCNLLVMSSFGQLHNLCLSYWLFGTLGNSLTLKGSPADAPDVN